MEVPGQRKGGICVRTSIAVGKERVYIMLQLLGHTPLMKSGQERKAETSRQELKQRLWRSAAYSLTLS